MLALFIALFFRSRLAGWEDERCCAQVLRAIDANGAYYLPPGFLYERCCETSLHRVMRRLRDDGVIEQSFDQPSDWEIWVRRGASGPSRSATAR